LLVVRWCLRIPVLVHPSQDEIGNLNIVLVLHDHVAVTVDAQFWWVEHLRIAVRGVDARDESSAIIEGIFPGKSRHAGGHV
jgi:hypothetical protein